RLRLRRDRRCRSARRAGRQGGHDAEGPTGQGDDRAHDDRRPPGGDMTEQTGAKGAMEVSNSEMQAFLDCRRRWMWSYYYKLQPKRESTVGPLPLGARVHKALEQGFSSPGRAEAMFAVLAASIEEDYPRAEAAGELEQFEKECGLAVIMLEGVVDWAAEEGLDAGWEVVSHERVVRTPEVELPSGDHVVF